MEMKRAERPMGKTVKWTAEEATDPSKHVFLGAVFAGELAARDTYRSQDGRETLIYKVKLDNGELVSVWSTAVIRDQMETGNNGEQVPVGARVEFRYQGKKQGKNKANRPYHVVEVYFGIPSPKMQPATTNQGVGIAGAPETTSQTPPPAENPSTTQGW